MLASLPHDSSPAPASTARTLPTAHGTIAYDVYGASGRPAPGKAVVAVPGLGDTRATWRALGPALADAGFVVYAMDLRGHGGSDVTFPSYTPEDIGDDIVALLEAEDLRGVALMGNSIGGAAIVHAALSASDRVGRLIHLNPFVRDMPADRWMRPLVPFLFARPWGAWVWSKYRSTLFKTEPEDHAANHATVSASFGDPARLAAVRGMLRASKASIAARLDELAVPSLVVMGSEDPDYDDPAAEGEALRGLLGDVVDVVMIERTGHYPQIERPEATAEAVLPFLRGSRGA